MNIFTNQIKSAEKLSIPNEPMNVNKTEKNASEQSAISKAEGVTNNANVNNGDPSATTTTAATMGAMMAAQQQQQRLLRPKIDLLHRMYYSSRRASNDYLVQLGVSSSGGGGVSGGGGAPSSSAASPAAMTGGGGGGGHHSATDHGADAAFTGDPCLERNKRVLDALYKRWRKGGMRALELQHQQEQYLAATMAATAATDGVGGAAQTTLTTAPTTMRRSSSLQSLRATTKKKDATNHHHHRHRDQNNVENDSRRSVSKSAFARQEKELRRQQRAARRAAGDEDADWSSTSSSSSGSSSVDAEERKSSSLSSSASENDEGPSDNNTSNKKDAPPAVRSSPSANNKNRVNKSSKTTAAARRSDVRKSGGRGGGGGGGGIHLFDLAMIATKKSEDINDIYAMGAKGIGARMLLEVRSSSSHRRQRKSNGGNDDENEDSFMYSSDLSSSTTMTNSNSQVLPPPPPPPPAFPSSSSSLSATAAKAPFTAEHLTGDGDASEVHTDGENVNDNNGNAESGGQNNTAATKNAGAGGGAQRRKSVLASAGTLLMSAKNRDHRASSVFASSSSPFRDANIKKRKEERRAEKRRKRAEIAEQQMAIRSAVDSRWASTVQKSPLQRLTPQDVEALRISWLMAAVHSRANIPWRTEVRRRLEGIGLIERSTPIIFAKKQEQKTSEDDGEEEEVDGEAANDSPTSTTSAEEGAVAPFPVEDDDALNHENIDGSGSNSGALQTQTENDAKNDKKKKSSPEDDEGGGMISGSNSFDAVKPTVVIGNSASSRSSPPPPNTATAATTPSSSSPLTSLSLQASHHSHVPNNLLLEMFAKHNYFQRIEEISSGGGYEGVSGGATGSRAASPDSKKKGGGGGGGGGGKALSLVQQLKKEQRDAAEAHDRKRALDEKQHEISVSLLRRRSVGGGQTLPPSHYFRYSTPLDAAADAFILNTDLNRQLRGLPPLKKTFRNNSSGGDGDADEPLHLDENDEYSSYITLPPTIPRHIFEGLPTLNTELTQPEFARVLGPFLIRSGTYDEKGMKQSLYQLLVQIVREETEAMVSKKKGGGGNNNSSTKNNTALNPATTTTFNNKPNEDNSNNGRNQPPTPSVNANTTTRKNQNPLVTFTHDDDNDQKGTSNQQQHQTRASSSSSPPPPSPQASSTNNNSTNNNNNMKDNAAVVGTYDRSLQVYQREQTALATSDVEQIKSGVARSAELASFLLALFNAVDAAGGVGGGGGGFSTSSAANNNRLQNRHAISWDDFLTHLLAEVYGIEADSKRGGGARGGLLVSTKILKEEMAQAGITAFLLRKQRQREEARKMTKQQQGNSNSETNNNNDIIAMNNDGNNSPTRGAAVGGDEAGGDDAEEAKAARYRDLAIASTRTGAAATMERLKNVEPKIDSLPPTAIAAEFMRRKREMKRLLKEEAKRRVGAGGGMTTGGGSVVATAASTEGNSGANGGGKDGGGNGAISTDGFAVIEKKGYTLNYPSYSVHRVTQLFAFPQWQAVVAVDGKTAAIFSFKDVDAWGQPAGLANTNNTKTNGAATNSSNAANSNSDSRGGGIDDTVNEGSVGESDLNNTTSSFSTTNRSNTATTTKFNHSTTSRVGNGSKATKSSATTSTSTSGNNSNNTKTAYAQQDDDVVGGAKYLHFNSKIMAVECIFRDRLLIFSIGEREQMHLFQIGGGIGGGSNNNSNGAGDGGGGGVGNTSLRFIGKFELPLYSLDHHENMMKEELMREVKAKAAAIARNSSAVVGTSVFAAERGGGGTASVVGDSFRTVATTTAVATGRQLTDAMNAPPFVRQGEATIEGDLFISRPTSAQVGVEEKDINLLNPSSNQQQHDGNNAASSFSSSALRLQTPSKAMDMASSEALAMLQKERAAAAANGKDENTNGGGANSSQQQQHAKSSAMAMTSLTTVTCLRSWRDLTGDIVGFGSGTGGSAVLLLGGTRDGIFFGLSVHDIDAIRRNGAQILFQYRLHNAPINDVCVLPNSGRVVTCALDGKLMSHMPNGAGKHGGGGANPSQQQNNSGKNKQKKGNTMTNVTPPTTTTIVSSSLAAPWRRTLIEYVGGHERSITTLAYCGDHEATVSKRNALDLLNKKKQKKGNPDSVEDVTEQMQITQNSGEVFVSGGIEFKVFCWTDTMTRPLLVLSDSTVAPIRSPIVRLLSVPNTPLLYVIDASGLVKMFDVRNGRPLGTWKTGGGTGGLGGGNTSSSQSKRGGGQSSVLDSNDEDSELEGEEGGASQALSSLQQQQMLRDKKKQMGGGGGGGIMALLNASNKRRAAQSAAGTLSKTSGGGVGGGGFFLDLGANAAVMSACYTGSTHRTLLFGASVISKFHTEVRTDHSNRASHETVLAVGISRSVVITVTINTFRTWSAHTGRVLSTHATDTYSVSPTATAAVDACGGLVVVGKQNGFVETFDVTDGQMMRRYCYHTSAVVGLQLDLDCGLIISAGKSGDVCVWRNYDARTHGAYVGGADPNVLAAKRMRYGITDEGGGRGSSAGSNRSMANSFRRANSSFRRRGSGSSRVFAPAGEEDDDAAAIDDNNRPNSRQDKLERTLSRRESIMTGSVNNFFSAANHNSAGARRFSSSTAAGGVDTNNHHSNGVPFGGKQRSNGNRREVEIIEKSPWLGLGDDGLSTLSATSVPMFRQIEHYNFSKQNGGLFSSSGKHNRKVMNNTSNTGNEKNIKGGGEEDQNASSSAFSSKNIEPATDPSILTSRIGASEHQHRVKLCNEARLAWWSYHRWRRLCHKRMAARNQDPNPMRIVSYPIQVVHCGTVGNTSTTMTTATASNGNTNNQSQQQQQHPIIASGGTHHAIVALAVDPVLMRVGVLLAFNTALVFDYGWCGAQEHFTPNTKGMGGSTFGVGGGSKAQNANAPASSPAAASSALLANASKRSANTTVTIITHRTVIGNDSSATLGLSAIAFGGNLLFTSDVKGMVYTWLLRSTFKPSSSSSSSSPTLSDASINNVSANVGTPTSPLTSPREIKFRPHPTAPPPEPRLPVHHPNPAAYKELARSHSYGVKSIQNSFNTIAMLLCAWKAHKSQSQMLKEKQKRQQKRRREALEAARRSMNANNNVSDAAAASKNRYARRGRGWEGGGGGVGGESDVSAAATDEDDRADRGGTLDEFGASKIQSLDNKNKKKTKTASLFPGTAFKTTALLKKATEGLSDLIGGGHSDSESSFDEKDLIDERGLPAKMSTDEEEAQRELNRLRQKQGLKMMKNKKKQLHFNESDDEDEAALAKRRKMRRNSRGVLVPPAFTTTDDNGYAAGSLDYDRNGQGIPLGVGNAIMGTSSSASSSQKSKLNSKKTSSQADDSASTSSSPAAAVTEMLANILPHVTSLYYDRTRATLMTGDDTGEVHLWEIEPIFSDICANPRRSTLLRVSRLSGVPSSAAAVSSSTATAGHNSTEKQSNGKTHHQQQQQTHEEIDERRRQLFSQRVAAKPTGVPPRHVYGWRAADGAHISLATSIPSTTSWNFCGMMTVSGDSHVTFWNMGGDEVAALRQGPVVDRYWDIPNNWLLEKVGLLRYRWLKFINGVHTTYLTALLKAKEEEAKRDIIQQREQRAVERQREAVLQQEAAAQLGILTSVSSNASLVSAASSVHSARARGTGIGFNFSPGSRRIVKHDSDVKMNTATTIGNDKAMSPTQQQHSNSRPRSSGKVGTNSPVVTLQLPPMSPEDTEKYHRRNKIAASALHDNAWSRVDGDLLESILHGFWMSRADAARLRKQRLEALKEAQRRERAALVDVLNSRSFTIQKKGGGEGEKGKVAELGGDDKSKHATSLATTDAATASAALPPLVGITIVEEEGEGGGNDKKGNINPITIKSSSSVASSSSVISSSSAIPIATSEAGSSTTSSPHGQQHHPLNPTTTTMAASSARSGHPHNDNDDDDEEYDPAAEELREHQKKFANPILQQTFQTPHLRAMAYSKGFSPVGASAIAPPSSSSSARGKSAAATKEGAPPLKKPLVKKEASSSASSPSTSLRSGTANNAAHNNSRAAGGRGAVLGVLQVKPKMQLNPHKLPSSILPFLPQPQGEGAVTANTSNTVLNSPPTVDDNNNDNSESAFLTQQREKHLQDDGNARLSSPLSSAAGGGAANRSRVSMAQNRINKISIGAETLRPATAVIPTEPIVLEGGILPVSRALILPPLHALNNSNNSVTRPMSDHGLAASSTGHTGHHSSKKANNGGNHDDDDDDSEAKRLLKDLAALSPAAVAASTTASITASTNGENALVNASTKPTVLARIDAAVSTFLCVNEKARPTLKLDERVKLHTAPAEHFGRESSPLLLNATARKGGQQSAADNDDSFINNNGTTKNDDDDDSDDNEDKKGKGGIGGIQPQNKSTRSTATTTPKKGFGKGVVGGGDYIRSDASPSTQKLEKSAAALKLSNAGLRPHEHYDIAIQKRSFGAPASYVVPDLKELSPIVGKEKRTKRDSKINDDANKRDSDDDDDDGEDPFATLFSSSSSDDDDGLDVNQRNRSVGNSTPKAAAAQSSSLKTKKKNGAGKKKNSSGGAGAVGVEELLKLKQQETLENQLRAMNMAEVDSRLLVIPAKLPPPKATDYQRTLRGDTFTTPIHPKVKGVLGAVSLGGRCGTQTAILTAIPRTNPNDSSSNNANVASKKKRQ